jgi:hypothetical protein
MLDPYKRVAHLAVEERDGVLFAAGIRIVQRPGRMAERTLWKIEDALMAASGSNVPVYLSHKTWLHRCALCRAPFLANLSARLCSPDCQKAARRESQRKQIAKRTGRRNQRRAALKAKCLQCGQPVAAERVSRRFCSAKCRMAAHRGRLAAEGL